MPRFKKALAAFTVAMLCSVAAQATPLAVTETTDFYQTGGGIPVGNHDTQLGLLDVGTNTISGHVGGIAFRGTQNPVFQGDYADRFSVELAAGQRIVGWMLTISGVSLGGGQNVSAGRYSGIGGTVFISHDLAPSSPDPIALDVPGIYDIELWSPFSVSPASAVCRRHDDGSLECTQTQEQFFQGAMSYTLRLDVESVPEPSTVLLTGLAFGLAGLARRRRPA